jgi:hypothetical protein
LQQRLQLVQVAQVVLHHKMVAVELEETTHHLLLLEILPQVMAVAVQILVALVDQMVQVVVHLMAVAEKQELLVKETTVVQVLTLVLAVVVEKLALAVMVVVLLAVLVEQVAHHLSQVHP